MFIKDIFWANPPCEAGLTHPQPSQPVPPHPLLLFDVVEVQLPPLVPEDQASAQCRPDDFGHQLGSGWWLGHPSEKYERQLG